MGGKNAREIALRLLFIPAWLVLVVLSPIALFGMGIFGQTLRKIVTSALATILATMLAVGSLLILLKLDQCTPQGRYTSDVEWSGE